MLVPLALLAAIVGQNFPNVSDAQTEEMYKRRFVPGYDAQVIKREVKAIYIATGLPLPPAEIQPRGGLVDTRYEAAVLLHAGLLQLEDRSAKIPKSRRYLAQELKHLMSELEKELASMSVDIEDMKQRISKMVGSAPISFRDVPGDHWAAKSVINLKEVEILHGYPDGSFNGGK